MRLTAAKDRTFKTVRPNQGTRYGDDLAVCQPVSTSTDSVSYTDPSPDRNADRRGAMSGQTQQRLLPLSRRCDSGFVSCDVQPLRADRMVDGKHDERAVPEHVRNIRATPSPGGRLDEGPAFVGVSDDSCRRGHVRDDRLL